MAHKQTSFEGHEGGQDVNSTFDGYQFFIGNQSSNWFSGTGQMDMAFGRGGNDVLIGRGQGDDLQGGDGN